MQLQDRNDEELAYLLSQAVADQNEGIFRYYSAAIYERFNRQVYKICRYYGLKHADAEDAAQESFVRLFRSAANYKKGMRFKSWFFRIVLNIVRDKYREFKRVRFADPEVLSDVPSDKGFTQKAHSDILIEKMLAELPEKLREAVMLKIYSAMDTDSIASVLGVSDRQVRNRLEQAYELLRKMGVENEIDA
jgi:RNA polymerase sigma-70 factor, ECF subfamily